MMKGPVFSTSSSGLCSVVTADASGMSAIAGSLREIVDVVGAESSTWIVNAGWAAELGIAKLPAWTCLVGRFSSPK